MLVHTRSFRIVHNLLSSRNACYTYLVRVLHGQLVVWRHMCAESLPNVGTKHVAATHMLVPSHSVEFVKVP